MPDPGFVATFNKVADDYDRRYGRACARAHDLILGAIAELSPRPRAVLDIGCGTGRLLVLVGEAWPEADLVGVDPAARMVEVARARTSVARLHVGGAERLPVDPESVDLVVSTTSFGHWADQEAGLREVARVLRPGGHCLIAEHLPPRLPVRIAFRLVNRLPHYRSAEQMSALVVGAGLELLSTSPADHGFLLTTARAPQRASTDPPKPMPSSRES